MKIDAISQVIYPAETTHLYGITLFSAPGERVHHSFFLAPYAGLLQSAKDAI